MRCPNCGTANPYTRFRCKSCNASLAKPKAGSGLGKVWLFVGAATVVIASILVLVLRAM
jgi:hypothetical protein